MYITEEKYKSLTKKISLKGNGLTQNKKWQSLNLKAKLHDKKWFVISDKWINKNCVTIESEYYDKFYC